MKKQAMGILLAFTMTTAVMLPVHVHAEETSGFEFKGNTVELTLDKAIETLLKDNPVIRQSEMDIEQAKIDSDKTSNRLSSLRKLPGADEEGSLGNMNIKLVNLSSQFMIDNAKRDFEATANGLKMDLEQLYYRVLQAEQVVAISCENAELSDQLLQKVKIKFNLGLVTKQEVIRAELNLIKAQNEIEKSMNNLRSLKMALNIKLGYDVMAQVKLNGDLQYKEFSVADLDEAVKSAVEKRYELKALEFARDSAKLNFDIIQKQYPENTYYFQYEKVKYLNALKNIEDARKNIELEIRNIYLTIHQMKKEIEAGKKAVEMAQDAFRLSNVSYEAGLGTQDDVQAAQLSLLSEKLALSNATLNYHIEVIKFQNSIGLGNKSGK